jgi:hypothetical protein
MVRRFALILCLGLAASAFADTAPTVYAAKNPLVSGQPQTYEIYTLASAEDASGNTVQVRHDIIKSTTVTQLNNAVTQLTTQQANIASYLALINAL